MKIIVVGTPAEDVHGMARLIDSACDASRGEGPIEVIQMELVEGGPPDLPGDGARLKAVRGALQDVVSAIRESGIENMGLTREDRAACARQLASALDSMAPGLRGVLDETERPR